MIEKVISGGQNGSDQGGVMAAKMVNIATGGWMPYGWVTLDGPRPEFAELYNMKEHPKKGYPPRTDANVRDSDGTIRIAATFGSAGEKCTLKAINWYSKPRFDVNINKPPAYSEVCDWIIKNKIKTLNVAGNSEHTSPGIGDYACVFMLSVFNKLKEYDGTISD